ncbi:hypothetical protein JHK87_004657 [Glycine soja]|nr:hypothetical protein JHK87_004657 [Glycine soja]
MECGSIAESGNKVVAVGINCTPPRFIHGLIVLLKRVTTKPIVIYPNSGETYDADLKEWVQTEVQKLLKQLADERFSEASNHSSNVNLVDKSRKVKVARNPIKMVLKKNG